MTDHEARRAWWRSGVVAAAVALVVGLGAVVGGGLLLGGDPASGGIDSWDEGTRSVSFRDVTVEVPASWGDDAVLGPDWCADGVLENRPRRPFVDTGSGNDFVFAIGCPGPVPRRYWVPHLSFDGGKPGQRRTGEWTTTTRIVGSVSLTLLTDDATRGLIDSILDSARVTAVDASGCDASSPVQAKRFVRPPTTDVADLEPQSVDGAAVCVYDRFGTDEPGLTVSRLLPTREARRLLAAVQDAPAGRGPDEPGNCVHDDFGAKALVVRFLRSGTPVSDLYVYYETCFGNGFDDGTTRRVLTEASCSPLFEGRVVLTMAQTSVFEICEPGA